MKRKYLQPDLDVIRFEAQDIVTSSVIDDGDTDKLDPVDDYDMD